MKSGLLKMSATDLIRATGICAVTGMLLVLITDVKLLYMPQSAKDYSTFSAAMAHSRGEILYYTGLAVLASPLVLLGLYHLSLTLARANKIIARLTVACYAYAYISAAIYYAFLAYVMLVAKVIIPYKLELPYNSKQIYFLLQGQYSFGIIGGSILFYAALAFFKNSYYPKWYSYFNPLLLIIVFRLALPFGLPPEFSGFFLTASFNLVMLITMIFSTVFLWNKSDDIFREEQSFDTPR